MTVMAVDTGIILGGLALVGTLTSAVLLFIKDRRSLAITEPVNGSQAMLNEANANRTGISGLMDVIEGLRAEVARQAITINELRTEVHGLNRRISDYDEQDSLQAQELDASRRKVKDLQIEKRTLVASLKDFHDWVHEVGPQPGKRPPPQFLD